MAERVAKRVPAALLAVVVVAWLVAAWPAAAYIDPGTGSAVFSSLAPILGMIGVVVIAALGFARTYVAAAARFAWRQKLWIACALVGLGVGLAVFLLKRGG